MELRPSSDALRGRRALEGMADVTLLEDFQRKDGNWVLHVRLTVDVLLDGCIPSNTDWYVLVDDIYPGGLIKVHPAKIGGITQTFPHQQYNGADSNVLPWRDGYICLSTSVHALGGQRYDDIEPFDPESRLRWHMGRALEWLSLASRKQLRKRGEPYELPQFLHDARRAHIVFSENAESYAKWKSISPNYGLLDLVCIRKEPDIFAVKSFMTTQNRILIASEFGAHLSKVPGPVLRGIWVRLNQLPVLQPWQAPIRWKEIQEACLTQGLNFMEIVKNLSHFIRDGISHYALVGFPIPNKIGDEPAQMHWLSIQLPILEYAINKFRQRGKREFWQRDRSGVLSGPSPIMWIHTENWDQQQISTRGRFDDMLNSKKILLIGAGALGSMVSELLVRGGAKQLTIIDADSLEMGNLVRHTLSIDDLRKNKAEALANRLNRVAAHASIDAIACAFPPQEPKMCDTVRSADIVIDCTAQDDVLRQMETYMWGERKIFFSASVGMYAKRLFIFSVCDERFPFPQFQDVFRKWWDIELAENAGVEVPREGTGCWHPVFPARADDLWIMASVVVKEIERQIRVGVADLSWAVFEQQNEDGVFIGVRKVPVESMHVPS